MTYEQALRLSQLFHELAPALSDGPFKYLMGRPPWEIAEDISLLFNDIAREKATKT